jgi:hypothetical protein
MGGAVLLLVGVAQIGLVFAAAVCVGWLPVALDGLSSFGHNRVTLIPVTAKATAKAIFVLFIPTPSCGQ